MGPHMTFHLAGGSKGMPGFMEHFVPAIERWWANMRQPALTEELKKPIHPAMLPLDEVRRNNGR